MAQASLARSVFPCVPRASRTRWPSSSSMTRNRSPVLRDRPVVDDEHGARMVHPDFAAVTPSRRKRDRTVRADGGSGGASSPAERRRGSGGGL